MARWIARSTWALTVLTLGFFVGCAQNTESPQRTDQAVVTPTQTNQDQATAGSQVYVNIWQGPGSKKPVDAPVPGGAGDVTAGVLDDLLAGMTQKDGGNLSEALARYRQGDIQVTVTTGGTTPTVTGTATGSGAGTQTGSQTTSPEQKPEATVNTSLGLAAPGGMVDQQTTAAGKGDIAGTQKTSENDLRFMRLEGAVDKMAQVLAAITQKFFTKEPETEPVPAGSQPSP